MTDLIAMAKRITPRVDEVVRSMYPPLDPRLLEARLVLFLFPFKYSKQVIEINVTVENIVTKLYLSSTHMHTLVWKEYIDQFAFSFHYFHFACVQCM